MSLQEGGSRYSFMRLIHLQKHSKLALKCSRTVGVDRSNMAGCLRLKAHRKSC